MRASWCPGLSLLLSFVAGGFVKTAASSRSHRSLAFADQPGICHYGPKVECCYGWRKNNKGLCEAICDNGCKYGECVGPNKCKCFPGFTGKTCSQDMNECGLKPRPCKHRCMNTHGSYKCYCLSGYMLMPDGTCSNSRTCAMTNCQYGCEDTKDEVRCLCPSTGLQLAPNGRACIDVDECLSGKVLCPYNRRCVNTFGSYYCKCHIGFELKYINGRYDCVDINECTANTHKCSIHADCLNTQGAFKCKCRQGYKGNGLHCSVIPENSVKEIFRTPGTIKDTIKKLLAHKNSVKKNEEIKNVIPEPAVTPATSILLHSFHYEDSIQVHGAYDGKEKEHEDTRKEDGREEEEGQIDLRNQIDPEQSLRGDVFYLNVSIDCSFDQGICDWKQDTEDDFDWNPADRDNAVGYYMVVPAFVGHKKDVGRLTLLLNNLQPQSSSCLMFDYRLAGERVGTLKVLVKDKNNAPAWEETSSEDGRWKTGKIQLYHGIETTKNIIFEAERGKGKTGEIAVDTVLLVSGLCPKGL
ncbi:epidermal growth factor-like protein 6 isoform X2 [Dromiciops gliroides]|uniref:epidermal growth factor-like protein 6 isoform X2 n=1 Tax=Dromiciops gliroides TaxID=33562 RepID=UPI001CC4E238|nr:epidermal growth factor-like protein 6 isoform X2 [Dromiciops gliroides]